MLQLSDNQIKKSKKSKGKGKKGKKGKCVWRLMVPCPDSGDLIPLEEDLDYFDFAD